MRRGHLDGAQHFEFALHMSQCMNEHGAPMMALLAHAGSLLAWAVVLLYYSSLCAVGALTMLARVARASRRRAGAAMQLVATSRARSQDERSA